MDSQARAQLTAAVVLALALAGCAATHPPMAANTPSATAAPGARPDVAPPGRENEAWRPHWLAGRRALRDGRLPAAVSELESAEALIAKDRAASRDARENVFFDLGRAYTERGDLARAKEAFEGAYAIDEAENGPDHPHTLETLEALAVVLDYSKDYAGAEARFRELLARTEKLRGAGSPEVARLRTNLAVNLGFQKRYAEVVPLIELAVPVLEKAGELDGLAHALNTLGTARYHAGDLAGARVAFGRALDVRERASGPGHPHVATILFNICGIDLDESKLEDAEKSCGRALAIREQTLPEDHPFRREVVERYAEIERRLGKK